MIQELGWTLALIFGALLTVLGGLLFTESVERIGSRYRLTTSLTGAVLAPLLTSLPELTVILVALFIHGGIEGIEIGIGTVVGEPFMASTIVYPLLVLTALIGYLRGSRTSTVLRPGREVLIPFIVFTVLFPLIILPALLQEAVIRYAIGCIMLLSYFAYVYVSAKTGTIMEEFEESRQLLLQRIVRNEKIAELTQLSISAILIFAGSRMLVKGVAEISHVLNVNPQIMSIIIIPSVAALPESIVGLVWAYRGRDTLAVASIVGEKVLYSTFYPGLTLLITEWILHFEAIFCIAVATLVSLLMIYYIHRGKVGVEIALIGLAGYVLYCLTVFKIVPTPLF